MRMPDGEKPTVPVLAPPAINPWAAVPFVALAGCVDAIGWLRFDQLFVSFIPSYSPTRAKTGANSQTPLY